MFVRASGRIVIPYEDSHLVCVRNNNSKTKCESAIGQHLTTNPQCTKTHTDVNIRIIGQARSSFPLRVLQSVDIKTQNRVLCRQEEFVFSLGLFK